MDQTDLLGCPIATSWALAGLTGLDRVIPYLTGKKSSKSNLEPSSL